MSARQRERWPDSVRAEALHLAAEDTAESASRATGVPAPTIRSWQHRATVQAAALGVVVPGGDAPWAERAPVLRVAFAGLAERAVTAAERAIEAGRSNDARNYGIVAGIAHDKWNMLAGGLTARTASLSVSAKAPVVDPAETVRVEAEIRHWRRELGELDEDEEETDDG